MRPSAGSSREPPTWSVVAAALAVVSTALLAAGAGPAQATHGDGTYEQPVWFEWSTATLDVLVIPPHHGQLINGNGLLGGFGIFELTPCTNSYLDAIKDGIGAWDRAVEKFGPDWLHDGLTLNVFVAGCGPHPTTTAFEIVIHTSETKGPILGVAVSTRPCIIDNSKFFVTSFTENDMFSISAHEFGHCLGLQHVADNHPHADLMDGVYAFSPGSSGNPRLCMSNLNVAGLAEVFADTLGKGGGGGTASVAVSDYVKMPC